MYINPELIGLSPEEILCYLRKSQSDDPLLTVSEVLEKHEKTLDEFAERSFGAKIPEHNKFREVVSGESIEKRNEFLKILQKIESPNIRAVLVVECSRLGRPDLEEIGRLSKLFRYTNTLIITPQRVFDLRDEYDREAFEREMMKSADYLNFVKKALRAGRERSVADGWYISSTPPYGFDKIKVKEGKKECPTLKENPVEANIVRMVFDMYGNQGMGRMAICHRLDELGIKPPKGEQWSSTSVKTMLRNVHYIGKTKLNWRRTIQIVENGEVKKKRPHSKVEECLVFEGKHEGLITQELFDKVQRRIGNNHRATTRVKLRNPFAGLIQCRNCGKAIVLKYFRDKNGELKCAPRMMCSDQSRCGSGSCTYDEFLDRISAILEQCIDDFEVRVNDDEGDTIKLHAELIKSLEKQMKELQDKELAQWELQSHPDPAQRMPSEVFQRLNEKLLKEKGELQQALCNAYETLPGPVDYEEKITMFKAALSALRNTNIDDEVKNELLKGCIEKIEFYKEKPQRLQSKGRGVFPMTFSNWTQPPIELDVTLKM